MSSNEGADGFTLFVVLWLLLLVDLLDLILRLAAGKTPTIMSATSFFEYWDDLINIYLALRERKITNLTGKTQSHPYGFLPPAYEGRTSAVHEIY